MSLRSHQFVNVEKPRIIVNDLNVAIDDFEKAAQEIDKLMELNVDAQLSVDNSLEVSKQINHIAQRFDESITYGPREIKELQKVEIIPKDKKKSKPKKVKEEKPVKKKVEKINYKALKKLRENLEDLRANI